MDEEYRWMLSQTHCKSCYTDGVSFLLDHHALIECCASFGRSNVQWSSILMNDDSACKVDTD